MEYQRRYIKTIKSGYLRTSSLSDTDPNPNLLMPVATARVASCGMMTSCPSITASRGCHACSESLPVHHMAVVSSGPISQFVRKMDSSKIKAWHLRGDECVMGSMRQQMTGASAVGGHQLHPHSSILPIFLTYQQRRILWPVINAVYTTQPVVIPLGVV
ncbi:hypothetical protein P153DRAFT_134814 [Dothidotthia symphoricarpi CBS 119687]|uniref:Uncharacterized protein n=1 Tax=Dothidotthia symphoricarpi CBS 119687 TaxID=1392245 RepID=A0A6A6A0A7_9PLEO|nr:uncharacterized protein P153DRAFT_134814 [Dothidotthia symphoricarpi CBS 119687]KAF2124584.1 hypothetical protein P153DRAFT_134814 [Dothidotthia symphoricarpi CBS 119687]